LKKATSFKLHAASGGPLRREGSQKILNKEQGMMKKEGMFNAQ